MSEVAERESRYQSNGPSLAYTRKYIYYRHIRRQIESPSALVIYTPPFAEDKQKNIINVAGGGKGILNIYIIDIFEK